jgi:polyisoprenoid-binding protein YceI
MKTLILSCLALFSFIFIKLSEPVQFNYDLDTERSIIEWTGAGPGVSHTGSFEVTSKGILVEDGHITGGSFTIPIVSIKNFDLPEEVKPVLLDHLKSEDFFNMALYPEAHFLINSVENINVYADGEVENANKMVYGEFTMLGKTFHINFPAMIKVEGDNIEVEANFKINRTKWGMDYAADPALGDHHIYPEVHIQLKLAGTRKLS